MGVESQMDYGRMKLDKRVLLWSVVGKKQPEEKDRSRAADMSL